MYVGRHETVKAYSLYETPIFLIRSISNGLPSAARVNSCTPKFDQGFHGESERFCLERQKRLCTFASEPTLAPVHKPDMACQA
jgi:hypothetical protein